MRFHNRMSDNAARQRAMAVSSQRGIDRVFVESWNESDGITSFELDDMIDEIYGILEGYGPDANPEIQSRIVATPEEQLKALVTLQGVGSGWRESVNKRLTRREILELLHMAITALANHGLIGDFDEQHSFRIEMDATGG